MILDSLDNSVACGGALDTLHRSRNECIDILGREPNRREQCEPEHQQRAQGKRGGCTDRPAEGRRSNELRKRQAHGERILRPGYFAPWAVRTVGRPFAVVGPCARRPDYSSGRTYSSIPPRKALPWSAAGPCGASCLP